MILCPFFLKLATEITERQEMLRNANAEFAESVVLARRLWKHIPSGVFLARKVPSRLIFVKLMMGNGRIVLTQSGQGTHKQCSFIDKHEN